MSRFSTTDDITRFAHALFSGDKQATMEVTSSHGWTALAKEIGPEKVKELFSSSLDTYTILLACKVLSKAYSALFVSFNELSLCLSYVFTTLRNNYSSHTVDSRSAIRAMIANIIRKCYNSTSISSIPSQLCREATEHLNSKDCDVDFCCLIFELLGDISSEMYRYDEEEGDHRVWVCHQLVRQQFEKDHLTRIVELAVSGFIKYANRFVGDKIMSLLSLTSAIFRVFIRDEEEDVAPQSIGSKSISLKNLSLIMDPSLYEKLWALLCQDKFQGDVSALKIFIVKMIEIMKMCVCFPCLRVQDSSDELLSIRQPRWLSLTLIQSGMLVQRLLPNFPSGGERLSSDDEDVLHSIISLLSLVKFQYSLEEMMKSPESTTVWIQGLVELTQYVLQHTRPYSTFYSLRTSLMSIWKRLSVAALSIPKEEVRGRLSEKAEGVILTLCQHCESLIIFSFQEIHCWDEQLNATELDDSIDEFVSFLHLVCSRRMCYVWKENVWQPLLNEVINALNGSTIVDSEGTPIRLQDACLKRLVRELSMQCAIIRVLEEDNCCEKEDADAIARILFQSISVIRRILDCSAFLMANNFHFLEEYLRRVFILVRGLLHLNSCLRQKRKDSVCFLLGQWIEGSSESQKTTVNSAMVEMGMNGIYVCLRVHWASDKLKKDALDLLEYLVFNPTTLSLIKANEDPNWSYVLLKGFCEENRDINLIHFDSRYLYARCLAQLFLHQNVSTSSSRESPLLFSQLRQQLENHGLRSAASPSLSLSFLICEARGILSCCATVEHFAGFLDAVEPFIHNIAVAVLRGGSCIGQDDTLEFLKLFSEIVKNRQRRINFGCYSVRPIYLIRFVRDVAVQISEALLHDNSPENANSLRDSEWYGEATTLLFSTTLNILKGNFCNFAVFKLYNDTALEEILESVWKIASQLTLSDYVERSDLCRVSLSIWKELGNPYFDWFWSGKKTKRLICIFDELAYNDRIVMQDQESISEDALYVLLLWTLSYIPCPTPLGQPIPTSSELHPKMFLNNAIRDGDPSFLERNLSRCIDKIFKTLRKDPSYLSNLQKNNNSSSSSASFRTLTTDFQLLTALMQSAETDYNAVEDFIVSQIAPTISSSLALRYKESIHDAFAELFRSASTIPPASLLSPSANARHINTFVLQFALSLNSVIHLL